MAQVTFECVCGNEIYLPQIAKDKMCKKLDGKCKKCGTRYSIKYNDSEIIQLSFSKINNGFLQKIGTD